MLFRSVLKAVGGTAVITAIVFEPTALWTGDFDGLTLSAGETIEGGHITSVTIDAASTGRLMCVNRG